ncbi:Thiopurine S-methyltransferase (Thiopurine methyltransferase) [Durusdinium trenchii]|uniref:Thiopurine S-methyltransferase (Thiopurine methyltransferase) n=1 Tax=Durusdinium trenchii TaxID=1381693 RepID=A0ABP0S128_9DINO
MGVEGVRKAVEEFEFGLQVPTAKGFNLSQQLNGREPPPPVIFLEGDFLELNAEMAKALVPFEAAFDRGSLVAVEPDDRKPYATALTHLMAPGGRVLLVTVEHDGFGERKGPPYQAPG